MLHMERRSRNTLIRTNWLLVIAAYMVVIVNGFIEAYGEKQYTTVLCTVMIRTQITANHDSNEDG